MPADTLTQGQHILNQQPFSMLLGARLDAFATGHAELS